MSNKIEQGILFIEGGICDGNNFREVIANNKDGEPRVKFINREQMVLRAVDIEKLVPEDHEVRAIWGFVDKLDLSRYYEDIEAIEGQAGCSAFDPRLKISLWLYSYSKGISSAREISRLCEHDPAYQWLTGMEVINYHTLSDFRIKNKESLDEIFVQVLGILSAEGLITLERVMLDGTRVKACASRDTFRREDRIREHLEVAKEQIRIMNETQEEEISSRVVQGRKRAVLEKQEKLELALRELEKIRRCKSGADEKREARVSETDPEARIMKQSDGGYAPSYNMQVCTDSTNKIIVGVRISQSGDDHSELVDGEEMVEKNLGEAPDQLVVDGGFISKKNIISMKEKGVDLIGAVKDIKGIKASNLSQRGIDPEFHPDKFCYDAESNTYTCPKGNVLRFKRKWGHIGYTEYGYEASDVDCSGCAFKEKCCPKSKGRMIVRNVNSQEVDEFIRKMESKESKAVYSQRGVVAEFPNAWIKDKIGLRQFSLQGLSKVCIEALWVCLTYNIQQWIRLCWRPGFA